MPPPFIVGLDLSGLLVVGLLSNSCRNQENSAATEPTAPSVDTSTGSTSSVRSSSSTTEFTLCDSSSGDPITGTTMGSGCKDGIPQAGSLCFLPSTRIGHRPSGALRIADLDHDAIPDLLAGHSDSISIYRGRGDGTFEEPVELDTSSGILGLATGPFDDDRWVDIAVSNTDDDSVSIYRNNGDGTFTVGGLIAVGESPRGIVAADFDGQGPLDLAVANQHSDTVSVLRGQGDGSFAVDFVLEVGTSPIAVAAADLDRNGTLDLLVNNFGSGNMSVFLTAGHRFGAGIHYATGVAPRSLVVRDFSGDGVLDVVTPNQANNTLCVLLGDGAGALGSPTFFPTGLGPRDGATGDFDGDGQWDLVIALGDANAVGILRGQPLPMGSFAASELFATVPRPVVVVVADLNADGVDDIVAGSTDAGGGIEVLLSDP